MQQTLEDRTESREALCELLQLIALAAETRPAGANGAMGRISSQSSALRAALLGGDTPRDILCGRSPVRGIEVAAAEALRPRAARQAHALLAHGIQVVPIWQLPPQFLPLAPPLALFVRGDRRLLDAAGTSIVGSRNASVAAERWAFARAVEAVQGGKIVVSGGAVGVDGAAHRGALSAGGPTIVYMGVAVDRCYPARHKELFAQIIERGGALVSEHPPATSPPRYSHALRNRFIAAHGDTLLIAQAREKSGTLGTARYAARLGRSIFVSPPEVGGDRGGLDWLLAGGLATVAGPRDAPAGRCEAPL